MTDTFEFSLDCRTFATSGDSYRNMTAANGATCTDKYTGTNDGAENVAKPKIGNVNH
jgi:hypothetical protein